LLVAGFVSRKDRPHQWGILDLRKALEISISQ
jgi:hypothetical protein